MTDTTNNQNQGCLAFLRLLGIKSKTQPTLAPERLPYRIRDDFLSPAEMSFYHVITSVAGSRATICPKVNLADIFFIVRPNENLAYRARIAQKHLDFLLCDPKSMRPIVGIELDDSSHARSGRQARDEFLDNVFDAAGLPLIHIAVQNSYNVNELATQFAQHLGNITPVSPGSLPTQSIQAEAKNTTVSSNPLCPKCGVSMVIRTARQGQNRGKQFYGCPNYPQCRQIIPFS